MLTRSLLLAAVVALYVLHQDVWFWRTARPLVFGFLPVGLAYHAAYCLAVARSCGCSRGSPGPRISRVSAAALEPGASAHVE